MKKNVLLIVLDSIRNDVFFNREYSEKCIPFLYKKRHNSVTGDNMFAQAPYTEAAFMCLLGSVDTMEYGYLKKFKDVKMISEVFYENGYKTYSNTTIKNVYPKYSYKGLSDYRLFEPYQFDSSWDIRFSYYQPLYLNGELKEDEVEFLVDLLESNLDQWVEYLAFLKAQAFETAYLNDRVYLDHIDEDIDIIVNEVKIFKSDKHAYLDRLMNEGKSHVLFACRRYPYFDKVKDDSYREYFVDKYSSVFKKMKDLAFRRNIVNNPFPFYSVFSSINNWTKMKGFLAGYKNALFDKDAMERVTENFDKFKAQRSFQTVANDFKGWVEKQDSNWFSYIHIDDAHYRENFFSYDSNDKELHEKEFGRINDYMDNLAKDYKGAISYDLALMYCDNVIKDICEHLKKVGQYENTVIMVTADHGYCYYYNPIRDVNLFNVYKETYNVPFIVFGDSIKSRKIEKFCTTKDVAPTLLSLAGLDVPSEFKGNALDVTEGEDYVFVEYMGQGCPDINRRPIILAVRTENYNVAMNVYAYKTFTDSVLTDVYDLKLDPLEKKNLFLRKGISEKISRELEIIEKRFNEIKMKHFGCK